MRGATGRIRILRRMMAISIHAPHAGSDRVSAQREVERLISIHAPHAGSDAHTGRLRTRASQISIHAPHAGSDFNKSLFEAACAGFQSTLPMRGATSCPEREMNLETHFNPRSPCGERHSHQCDGCKADEFQSTLPMRGATLASLQRLLSELISIHAPHAGSDYVNVKVSGTVTTFQSTLPMRGATGACRRPQRAGGNFNPRSPCGERPRPGPLHRTIRDFNPRSPCGERLALG